MAMSILFDDCDLLPQAKRCALPNTSLHYRQSNTAPLIKPGNKFAVIGITILIPQVHSVDEFIV